MIPVQRIRFNPGLLLNTFLLLALLLPGEIFALNTQTLNVIVTDGIDNTRLINQNVNVFRRETDGSLQGIRTIASDVNGEFSLDLPGLGSGSVYVLRTAMKYGGQMGFSRDIDKSGQFVFRVGNVRVKAVNGQTGLALGQGRINAYTRSANATDIYVSGSSAISEANGFADFDLPALGNGQTYVFKAQSTFDYQWRTSELVSQPGLFQFKVGNRLLNITLTDGISNNRLANQSVNVLQREATGNLKGLRTETTDAYGELSLDLPGLGGGTVYVLRTAVKHGTMKVYSSDLEQTGNFAFKAGNVRVKAINGQTGGVLKGQQINANKMMADGSETYFKNAITDDSGLADFDLPDLESGQSYLFKTQNPFDSTWRTSSIVSQSGLINFVVGNKLLNITVNDSIHNIPLANQTISILRHEADGSLKGFRNVTTDANGKLSLDLPGLGIDTTYVLRTQQLYGAGVVFSDEITKSGNLTFNIGNVLVKVSDGATDQPLKGQDVTIMEEMIDGGLSWYARVATDQNGRIPLHLPNLGKDGKYILKAQTLLDKRWVNSQLIINTGTFDFSVGNQWLNVKMLSALEGKPLSNVEVTAFERMSDLSLRWFQRKSTNTEGRVDFDLPDLGQGTSYVLKANPFGSLLETKDIEKTGPLDFLAGSLVVKLYQSKTGEVMPGQSLILFEKGTNGRLIWRKTLVTNPLGEVRFDPLGLGDGRLFVIQATNLFGNGKHHYSRWIKDKGRVDFAVDPDDPDKLDDEPPVFVNFKPVDNTNVASQGFQLQMKITDNQKVERVSLTINNPILGTFSSHATQIKGDWYLTVSSNMLTAGQRLTVNAEAYDKVGNHAALSRHYLIINDTKPPEIVVSSHQSGNQIDEHGFAMLGSVSDNTAVKSLRATVIDPIKGTLVNREIEIGDNGYWGLAVSRVSRGQTVTVTLSAEDWAGNQTQKQWLLPVMTESISAAQLINRMTFGATPELLKELRNLGAEAFMQKQLQPELINDSEFESYLPGVLNQEPNDMIKLQHAQIAHASYSKKQFLELMSWFWENHFNTDRSKTATDFELAENNGFRRHALGRFRDLLAVSAKSPAMLLFLDNHSSNKAAPNENYARELLELHTLGVDNGYTTKDVAEVARVFTGWRVVNRLFNFTPGNHDNGEKTVLGTTIPAGSGLAGGEQVLDLLSSHPSTARHICRQLLKLLITDQPTEASVADCADDFINYAAEENQIARVLEGILRSPAFSASSNFHNKIKIPLEYTSGLFRQLPIVVSYANTRNLLKDMGMHLYYFDEPTGWPEESDYWVNGGQLMQRWQFAGQAVMNKPAIWRNYWEQPAQFFIDKGIETPEGVVAFLFELTLSHDYTTMEFVTAKAMLTNNNTERFDIHDSNADEKLRKLVALIFDLPAYQLQ